MSDHQNTTSNSKKPAATSLFGQPKTSGNVDDSSISYPVDASSSSNNWSSDMNRHQMHYHDPQYTSHHSHPSSAHSNSACYPLAPPADRRGTILDHSKNIFILIEINGESLRFDYCTVTMKYLIEQYYHASCFGLCNTSKSELYRWCESVDPQNILSVIAAVTLAQLNNDLVLDPSTCRNLSLTKASCPHDGLRSVLYKCFNERLTPSGALAHALLCEQDDGEMKNEKYNQYFQVFERIRQSDIKKRKAAAMDRLTIARNRVESLVQDIRVDETRIKENTQAQLRQSRASELEILFDACLDLKHAFCTEYLHQINIALENEHHMLTEHRKQAEQLFAINGISSKASQVSTRPEREERESLYSSDDEIFEESFISETASDRTVAVTLTQQALHHQQHFPPPYIVDDEVDVTVPDEYRKLSHQVDPCRNQNFG